MKTKEEIVTKYKKDRHIADDYKLGEDENYLIDEILKALNQNKGVSDDDIDVMGKFEWEQLRIEFFDECVYIENRLPKFDIAPHDLFEWFKSKLNIEGVKETNTDTGDFMSEIKTFMDKQKNDVVSDDEIKAKNDSSDFEKAIKGHIEKNKPKFNNGVCGKTCNCIEMAEYENGGQPVKSNECLGGQPLKDLKGNNDLYWGANTDYETP